MERRQVKTGEMAWCAFPTACAKIRMEISHKNTMKIAYEVIHRAAEHRKQFWRPPRPSPQPKQLYKARLLCALLQSHPEHLQGWRLHTFPGNLFNHPHSTLTTAHLWTEISRHGYRNHNCTWPACNGVSFLLSSPCDAAF